MKMYLSKIGQNARVALLAVCFVGLAACFSPAEKASKYYEKGLVLMVQGDLLKARTELQNALQIRPDLIGAWFALAAMQQSQGDQRAAEAVFRSINEKSGDSPNFPRTLLMQAKSHELAGAPELAQESYLKAYEAGKSALPFDMAYGILRLRECGNVASNLREPLRVFQHTGVNLSLDLISLRCNTRDGSIAKMI